MTCLECSQELLNKWQTKFCSRTCSAIYNNKRRDSSKIVICHLCNNSFLIQKHIIRKKYSCKEYTNQIEIKIEEFQKATMSFQNRINK